MENEYTRSQLAAWWIIITIKKNNTCSYQRLKTPTKQGLLELLR